MKRDDKAGSMWPRIFGSFLLAMLLLTLLSRAADSILLPVVQCASPLPGALKHTVVLNGLIAANEQWPIMAEPDIPVAQVYVRAGQRVKAGDVLLSYDSETVRRMLAEKQTALTKLTMQARLDALGQKDSDAEEEGDADSSEKQLLAAQLSRLEMDAAQREVDRLSLLLSGGAALIAPVDGTIGDVLVKPGDTVAGAAFRLSPASSGLIVRAAVIEDQMTYLQPDMEAKFQRTGEARVGDGVAVLTGISATETGYEASFELPDGAGSMGQAISITVTQNTDTYRMRVPLSAIVYNGADKGVYRIRTGQSVLGEMEYAELVTVTVIEADAQYAAIEASLSEQDQVITTSSKPLSAGDRVRSSP